MRFVERLTQVKRFLGRIAKEAVGFDLDVCEGIRFGLIGLLMLCLAGEHGRLRFYTEACYQVFAEVDVQQELAFFIHAGLCRRGLPFGREGGAVRVEVGGDSEVGLRLEVVDGIVAAGHHRERWCLDAADGDELTFSAGRLIGKRIGAGEVHADQPIGAGTGAGGVTHTDVIRILL